MTDRTDEGPLLDLLTPDAHHDPEMPFGKYRGSRISTLPNHYISWLLDLPDLRPGLEAALRAEWQKRKGAGKVTEKLPDKPPAANRKMQWWCYVLRNVGNDTVSSVYGPYATKEEGEKAATKLKAKLIGPYPEILQPKKKVKKT